MDNSGDTISAVVFFIFGVVIIVFATWRSVARRRRFDGIYASAQWLKKHTPASGKFFIPPYQSREDFLDYMGQFLKWKKHEWIFVAFMKHGEYSTVELFWLNKGLDSTGVSPFLRTEDIETICIENGCNHVLIGHNHPAGALSPSKQDRFFLESCMDSLAEADISVEHIVFVAGRWRKYSLSIGQRFRRFLD